MPIAKLEISKIRSVRNGRRVDHTDASCMINGDVIPPPAVPHTPTNPVEIDYWCDR
jgi:hypothetical protein